MWNDFATGGDCGALSNSVVRWCHQEKHLTAGDVGLIYLYRVDTYVECVKTFTNDQQSLGPCNNNVGSLCQKKGK